MIVVMQAGMWLGYITFGFVSDRIGRKTTLIITLLVMGIASAAIGILPGTASIGVAAPLLLVTLRVLQGIAVGGEWSGSVLLTMEWGDQKRRGLLGSFAQIGVPVGLVLGTGGMTLLSATMSDETFDSWGWRVPFLASLVLVAVGLVIRLKILETPMFKNVLDQGKTASAPGMASAICGPNAVVPEHNQPIARSRSLKDSFDAGPRCTGMAALYHDPLEE